MITNASIALIGDTEAGKTTQVGQLAKAVRKATGKNTVLYRCDRGGTDAIQHLIDLEVIKEVPFDSSGDIFVWLNHVSQGEEPDGKGGWKRIDRDKIGLWVFESGTSAAEESLTNLARQAGEGVQIGGKSSYKVQLGDGSKLASNTETHFGVVQSELRSKIWLSQALPGIVMWTFALDRKEDVKGDTRLGPMLAGHALTTMIPRWFRYTFRIDSIPVQDAKPRHVLYLTSHTNGVLGGYGNARVPLEGFDELEAVIEPADLPRALNRVEELRQKAAEMTRQELGL